MNIFYFLYEIITSVYKRCGTDKKKIMYIILCKKMIIYHK